MSGIKIIRALLVADAAVLALVPGTRIQAGILPQGTALPYISITSVSGVDFDVVKVGAITRVTQRIQLSVVAASYAAKKPLLTAIRSALRGRFGAFAGYQQAVVQTDAEGPDLDVVATGFFSQSQDFKVSFNEPT